MAVEQIRPVEGQRKAAQRKTQELNVDTAITILFGTSRLEAQVSPHFLLRAKSDTANYAWQIQLHCLPL